MLKKFFAFLTLIALLNFSVAFAAHTTHGSSHKSDGETSITTDRSAPSSSSDSVNADEFSQNSSSVSVPDKSAQSSLFNSVVDTTNTLNDNEIRDLRNKIRRVEMAHNIKIGIEFLKNTHGQSVSNTAANLLEKNFSGAPNGGILLLIVMDTRKWQIATDSVMLHAIPDKSTEKIAQDFLPHLSGGDYYTACSNFIDNVDRYLTSYENGTPIDETEFNPLALMGAILCAIVIAGIFRSSLISSMSNVAPATTAKNYLNKNSVNINQSRDTYLFTKVTRRRKGGGSSGGGGGRSGGGSGGSF